MTSRAEHRESNAQLLRDMEAMRAPGVTLKTVQAKLGVSDTRAWRTWRAAHPHEMYLIVPPNTPKPRSTAAHRGPSVTVCWDGETRQELLDKRKAALEHAKRMRAVSPVQHDEAAGLVQQFLAQHTITVCPARAVAPVNNGAGF